MSVPSLSLAPAVVEPDLDPRRTGIYGRPRLVHGTFTFFEGLDDGGGDHRSRELSRHFVFGLQRNQLGISPSCLADCYPALALGSPYPSSVKCRVGCPPTVTSTGYQLTGCRRSFLRGRQLPDQAGSTIPCLAERCSRVADSF
ncbi:MAG TPA: hypothetical protein PKW35_20245, partial [Nannocystaceae bacterium]|nr:hypothetical protein [Nannocystaceae bacterium]